MLWARLAGLYTTSLLQLGRLTEAKEYGARMIETADRVELGTYLMDVTQPMALVEAALGRFDAAMAYAEGEIQRFMSIGATGVVLGMAYETRARVAIAMRDAEAFQKYSDLCAAEYRVGQNPPLTARFERLIQDARRGGASPDGDELKSAIVSQRPDDVSKLTALLSACRGPRERAERALGLVLDEMGLPVGFLYAAQGGGITLSAYAGIDVPPPGLDTAVARYLTSAADETSYQTKTSHGIHDRISKCPCSATRYSSRCCSATT